MLVQVEKSDNQTVVLRNVSLKASGLFRCEVSTEAPSFLTKSIERKLSIYCEYFAWLIFHPTFSMVTSSSIYAS